MPGKSRTTKKIKSGPIKNKISPQKPALTRNEREKVKKIKIRVIGIGGGAGNIVSEIAAKISKASFVAANTDAKSLKSCSNKVAKFQFGQSLTQGLGTGMNVELGEAAAKEEKEKIKKLCQNQDLCILIACLGGGTGTGAISTFAKISKDLGNLTYGIFTLPFKFEGEKKLELSVDWLKKAKNHLSTMTVIPNERVFQVIDKDTPLKEALSTINKFLCQSLSGLIETIYQPGLINIDFADFRTILQGRGRLAYLNAVEFPKKEEAVKDLTEKVISSPFYPYTIRGAKGVLFNIIGKKSLLLAEVGEISKTISGNVNSEAKIIFGVSQPQKPSKEIKTVLLATGCAMKIYPPLSAAKKPLPKEKKPGPAKQTKKAFQPEKKEENEKEVKPETKEKPEKATKSIKQKAKLKKEPELAKKESVREKTVSTEKEGNKKNKIRPLAVSQQNDLKNKAGQKKKIFASQSMEQIRKNGLQVKKEVEEMEKEMLEKEKMWEKPAFLRKKLMGKGQNN